MKLRRPPLLRRFSVLLFCPVLGAAPLTAEEPGKIANKAAPAHPQAAERLSMDALVDGLDQANLQEAFRLLRSDYINREDLDPLEVNRAALQGMLERLDFGAMLLTERSRSGRDSPFSFYAERISGEIGYVRFGRYTQEEVARFDEILETYSGDEEVETLLLDLRSPQAQADFAIAAAILSRFLPPNELLFKIRRPGNERATLFISKAREVSWQGETILLVDGETGNVAEIIAAVLDREKDTLVIGEATPGLTVEYRDVPIGEDRILRYAIAEVILEDDSTLFRTGIEPDLVDEAQPALARGLVERPHRRRDVGGRHEMRALGQAQVRQRHVPVAGQHGDDDIAGGQRGGQRVGVEGADIAGQVTHCRLRLVG